MTDSTRVRREKIRRNYTWEEFSRKRQNSHAGWKLKWRCSTGEGVMVTLIDDRGGEAYLRKSWWIPYFGYVNFKMLIKQLNFTLSPKVIPIDGRNHHLEPFNHRPMPSERISPVSQMIFLTTYSTSLLKNIQCLVN